MEKSCSIFEKPGDVNLKACGSLQQTMWISTRKYCWKYHIQLSLISDIDWLYVPPFQKSILGSWQIPRGKKKANNVSLWQRNVFCKVNLALSGIACVLKFCTILHFPESIFRVHTCSIQQHSKDLFAHLVRINMFSICLELLNECPANMMQDEKLIWYESCVRPPMNSLIFVGCQLSKTLLRSFQFWNVCVEIKSPPESIKKALIHYWCWKLFANVHNL